MARAMIACAPIPMPMRTMVATHMKVAPKPTPSSAAPAVPGGRFPARSVSVVPTSAAMSCCTNTGMERIQIDCHRLLPASRPLLMIRSSSAAASAPAIESAPSPNESISPSAARRRKSAISARASASAFAFASAAVSLALSGGCTAARVRWSGAAVGSVGKGDKCRRPHRCDRRYQPFSPRFPNSFCGAPSAGAVSRIPAGTPGCSKVGIAQNIK